MKGYSDVVEILKGQLQQTRGEKLLDLRWQSGKLWRDGPPQPSNYSPKFYNDVSILQRELIQSQFLEEVNRETKALDSEDVKGANVDITEETMEVELTAEERQEKDEARSKIIDIEEVEIPLGRKLLGQVSIEDRTPKNELVGYLSKFTVDMTACPICKVTFKSSGEERALVRQQGNSPVILWKKIGQPATNCNRRFFNGFRLCMECLITYQKSQEIPLREVTKKRNLL